MQSLVNPVVPQAGLLAQELLQQRLAEHGYHQSNIIPGLWKHETRPITFTLVVHNYINKEDSEHLMSVLKKDHEVTENWKGETYTGMHVRLDYQGRKVHTYILPCLVVM